MRIINNDVEPLTVEDGGLAGADGQTFCRSDTVGSEQVVLGRVIRSGFEPSRCEHAVEKNGQVQTGDDNERIARTAIDGPRKSPSFG